ncbi:hypothetical protein GP486_002214, partial [Trichoglossum hirsutum]
MGLHVRTAGTCYATIGVHPCSTALIDLHPQGPTAYLDQLESLALTGISTSRIVAFGEIGLDYDRLFLTPKDQQLKYFAAQLALATRIPPLPLFLHSRAAGADFERLVGEVIDKLPRKGVVHSFTGTKEEMWGL